EGLPDATTDPAYDEQWFHTNAKIPNTWNHLNHNGVHPGGSHDVVVAVIDSGVDYTHEELAANMWTNPGEIPNNGIDDDGNGFVDDVYGANVVSNPQYHSGDPMDLHGHGTHVAGIIAAQGFNEVGGVGVAFNTKIMAVRAAQYSGTLTVQDIAEGIQYAVDNGADVINMSFGGYQHSQMVQDALEVALNQAVLVAAAGNDSLSIHEAPFYPAAIPWVLGVVAMTPDNRHAWFTNTGYEVRAPGVGIHSTLPGDRYAAWSGTSMAAPVVSGISALMRSYYWQRDLWSSRFIQGSIYASGFDEETGTVKEVVDAYRALTEPPAPGVRLYATWLFDDPSIDPANDGDGRADAGETIHIGFELINRSGQADHVISILDAISPGAALSDPYVEILSNTVAMQGIGPFARDDNGLIYDEDGVITGVEAPWIVKIKPNCPNDHVIPFLVTTYFEDGWDPDPEEVMYTRLDRFSSVVQQGENVPTVISEDLTLTADKMWIVAGPVLVEPDVTLTVEPGTQVQWGGVSTDPYNPGPQSGYIVVRGTLLMEGTEEHPINLFPSYLVAGQTVDIRVESRDAKVRYAKILNPSLTGFYSIDHCHVYRDSYAATVEAYHISNSLFHKFRQSGSYIRAHSEYDTVLFDAGWYGPQNYGSYHTEMIDSVVLQDNEDGSPLSYSPSADYDESWLLDPSYRPYHVVEHDGKTYALLRGGVVAVHEVYEKIANYFGGHLAMAKTPEKEDFLRTYWSERPPLGGYDQAGFGLVPDGDYYYEWVDGTPLTYTNWTDGYPRGGYQDLYEGCVLKGEGRWRPPYWANEQHWHSGQGIYLLELPGSWTLEQLYEPFDEGTMQAYIQEHLPTHITRNALLSPYWDPDVSDWMKFHAPGTPSWSTITTSHVNMRDNFWGTDSTTLVDHAIVDYQDNFTTISIDYGTLPSHGFESTYPFVERVFVNGVSAAQVPVAGAGPTTFTIDFNRDMDPEVHPYVTFGPSPPHTDFTVYPMGQEEIVFPVTLSQPASEEVTVSYTTVDGTAVAGVDYEPRSGTLTYRPGQTEKTVAVPILGDHQDEFDKSFFLELLSPTYATLDDAEAQGTIVDDDCTVSIGDTSVVEVDSGTVDAVFTVTLSEASDETVTVDYETMDGTALAVRDYQPTSGTLTFAPGELEKQVAVPVFGDVNHEADTTFSVVLRHPRQANIAEKTGEATIFDNDPLINISDTSVVEGTDGSVDMEFTVTLSAEPRKTITV
ncbi:MAG: S8 family serine peptidase, partial [Planctomycetota bacterium]